MIYAYYGTGQGKTSALNGICLRAVASRKPIMFVRFFKSAPSSEDAVLERLGVTVRLFQTANEFIWTKSKAIRERIVADARRGLDFVSENHRGAAYLFLDEFLDLVANRVIRAKECCDLLKRISAGRFVFVSGHAMPPSVARLCDVVTRTEAVKHHYANNVKAKRFIDY